MKNLYNRIQDENFAEINVKFIWQSQPPKLKKYLGELETAAKGRKKTEESLKKLSNNVIFSNSLDKHYEILKNSANFSTEIGKIEGDIAADLEANGVSKAEAKKHANIIFKDINYRVRKEKVIEDFTNYRKDLLDKDNSKIEVNKTIKESEIEELFAGISKETGESLDQLRASFGLGNMNLDKDDYLDLDEFEKSQDFAVENIEPIVDQLIVDIAKGPETTASMDMATALASIKIEITPLLENLKNGDLNNYDKEQLEKNIQDKVILYLQKSGLDMGNMLEEFADLARREGKIPQGDIDKTLDSFIKQIAPAPAFETKDAPVGSIQETMMQNKELTAFLAEYYPPRDFEQDLKKYTKLTGITMDANNFADPKKGLPNFFWVMNLDGKSISDQLKLYKIPEAYAKLREAMILDENRSVESTSPLKTASMFFQNIWSSFQSTAPSYFKHFQFGEKDFDNAENIEILFKNKMANLLGSNEMSFAKVKNLTRKITLQDQPEIINGLLKTIPKMYKGGEIAKRYIEELKTGQTRQEFIDWMKSDDLLTGEPKVSKWAHIGNFLKFFRRLWLRIQSLFGDEEATKKLKEYEDSLNDKDKDIETALANKATLNEGKENQKAWKSSPYLNEYIKFHTKNKKVLNFVQPDIELDTSNPHDDKTNHEGFTLIDPVEFHNTWDSKKSREILKWARAAKNEVISKKNWEWVVEHQTELKVDNSSTPAKLSRIQELIPGRKVPNSITIWNDTEIEKLKKDDPRIEYFKSINGEGENNSRDILDMDVQDFFKYEDILFKDPKKLENKKLNPVFAELFSTKMDKYRGDYKITANDLELIKQHTQEGGILEDGLETEFQTGTSDNDYYDINGGKLITVKDGKDIDSNDEEYKEGVDQDTFEIDVDGSSWDADFTSLESFFTWLKTK